MRWSVVSWLTFLVRPPGPRGSREPRLQEFLTNTGVPGDGPAPDAVAQDQRWVSSMTRDLPRKGHSVGVARQYNPGTRQLSGAVTSHYDGSFDWPIAARLYLPEGWTQPAPRRRCPRALPLSLERAGLAAAVPTEAVRCRLGDQPRFLDGLEIRGLPYLVLPLLASSGPGCGRGRRTTSPAVPGPR